MASRALAESCCSPWHPLPATTALASTSPVTSLARENSIAVRARVDVAIFLPNGLGSIGIIPFAAFLVILSRFKDGKLSQKTDASWAARCDFSSRRQ